MWMKVLVTVVVGMLLAVACGGSSQNHGDDCSEGLYRCEGDEAQVCENGAWAVAEMNIAGNHSSLI